MNLNFPLILVILTAVSGLIALFDILFLAKKRKDKKMPVIIDYARSFFPVFLIVLVIRSFVVQPYRVPTGSLEPSVLPNDFIVVSQFAYGLRLPVLNTKVLNIGKPKRGDIAVFRFPARPSVDFVKRVIGVPGDHIIYKNKILFINGKKMTQKYVKDSFDTEPGMPNIAAQVRDEDLEGIQHQILINANSTMPAETYDFIVPKGYYFMMGDNRDDSGDSRFWGFVPEKNLVGKAMMIWLSWDSHKFNVRWSRIGTIL